VCVCLCVCVCDLQTSIVQQGIYLYGFKCFQDLQFDILLTYLISTAVGFADNWAVHQPYFCCSQRTTWVTVWIVADASCAHGLQILLLHGTCCWGMKLTYKSRNKIDWASIEMCVLFVHRPCQSSEVFLWHSCHLGHPLIWAPGCFTKFRVYCRNVGEAQPWSGRFNQQPWTELGTVPAFEVGYTEKGATLKRCCLKYV
jgi:hypothetical protein